LNILGHNEFRAEIISNDRRMMATISVPGPPKRHSISGRRPAPGWTTADGDGGMPQRGAGKSRGGCGAR